MSLEIVLLILVVIIILAAFGGWWGSRAGWWTSTNRSSGPTYGVPFSNGSATRAGPSGYVEGTTNADYVGPAIQGPNDVGVRQSGWNPMYFVILAIVIVALIVGFLVMSGFAQHIKQF